MIKEAIEAAGGNIYVLSFEDRVADYQDKIQGYLIPGGRDLNPSYYGEENNGSKFSPVESKLRWEHLKDVMENLDRKIPIFALCFGMQFLNVYFGGSLVGHLDNSSQHTNTLRDIIVDEDSHLYKATKKTVVSGICLHHQGIKNLAKDFKITAKDQLDDSPHAIEYTGGDRTIFSVIWHPENPGDKNITEVDGYQIFRYLVELASKNL